MSRENQTLEISWASFWKLFFIVISLILIYHLWSVLVMIFVAIIISAALTPLVDWFEKKHLPRFLGAIIIYLGILIVLALFLYFSLPILYEQILNIISYLPYFSEDKWQNFLPPQLSEKFSDFLSAYQGSLIQDAGRFFSIILNLSGGIVAVITVFLISFYLLLKKDGVADFIKFILPISVETTALKIWYRSKLRLGRWLRTQLFLSAVVGIMVLSILLLLGVKYAFILAIFAAFCELIPVVGPILAGIVSTLVALTQSLSLAFWTAVLFILMQQLENHILVPVTMRKAIGFNPVIVIGALLSGAKLGGVIGILIALPTIIVIEETIKELNNKKRCAPLPLP